MMKREVSLIKMDTFTRNNLYSEETVDFVSLFAIGISKKDTGITSGSKLIPILFRSRDETKRTKGFKISLG